MEEIRKIITQGKNTKLVSIPSYFLKMMKAEECKKAIVRYVDEDKINIEVIRSD